MGCDTLHWEDLGRILQKGGPQADGEEILERTGWSMGLPPAGGRNGGGSIVGGGDLRIPLPEHSRTVYCDRYHYVPVSSGRAGGGVKGDEVVVVSGRTGCGGDAYGGLRGVMDRTETDME